MQYAGIIVDITSEKLNRVFTYRIPESLQEQIEIGTEVVIPFGKGNRMIHGYVITLQEQTDVSEDSLKDIIEVVTNHNAIESRLVELAAWMAKHYGSTMISALRTVLPAKERIKERKNRTIILTADEDTARDALEEMRRKNHKARARLLYELINEREIPYRVAKDKLHVTTPVLKALTEAHLCEVTEERQYRIPTDLQAAKEKDREKSSRPKLTTEQEAAVERIKEDLRRKRFQTYLLYGITGSGKTEVYLHAIEDAVKQGGQAIVLIPEIALTYQTVMRFYKRFGERVSVIHSRLSKGERYDQFIRAKNGELDVVIGPRSALFMPLPNLKLIVIDEEHETSYKSDQAPRFHARDTAVYRAKQEGASVILGSATPSLTSFLKAQNGEYTLLRLSERVKKRPLASTEIVDLREELKKGNHSMISESLDQKIRDRLERHEQVMLFLNRRGYSGFVSCRECGEVLKCPHCDVSLSEHRGGRLLCHYCGYETKLPRECPSCQSTYIGRFKAGTQQIESFLQERYPKARILRMDFDTTRQKESYTNILSAFGNHEADILLGTQMIVKGHDFPSVTLVGVLAADMSLYASDFNAAERTFSLLTQAAGRAGRGDTPGEVIIQTYDPDHYAIQAAAKQDYERFFKEEMLYREMASYPPASHLLSFTISSKDEAYLNKAVSYLATFSKTIARKYGAECFGPGTPSIGKLKDVYRKVLYYKHVDYDILVTIKDHINDYISINKGFDCLMVQINFEG